MDKIEPKSDDEMIEEKQKSLPSIKILCTDLGSNPSCLPVIEEILDKTKHETLYDYFASINPEGLEGLSGKDLCDAPCDSIPSLLENISKRCLDFLSVKNPDLYGLISHTQDNYKSSIGDVAKDLFDYGIRDSFFEIRYSFFWLVQRHGIATALEFLKEITRKAVLVLCQKMGVEIPQKILDRISDEEIKEIRSEVVTEAIQLAQTFARQMREIELHFPDLPNEYDDPDPYFPEDKAWFEKLLDTYPDKFEEIIAGQVLDMNGKSSTN